MSDMVKSADLCGELVQAKLIGATRAGFTAVIGKAKGMIVFAIAFIWKCLI